MYLKSIQIENVGPITKLNFALPFEKEKPLPLVLVGPNGSGKTTVLSYIVSALVGFKQQGFENAEVEQQKVYRMRGPKFIRHGANWYHVELEFEAQMKLTEWVIDRPRAKFEVDVRPLPDSDGWKEIPIDDVTIHKLMPEASHPLSRIPSKQVQEQFAKNAVLYFASDRSEVPNWLNGQALLEDQTFLEPNTVQGETRRRIFSKALLKPTLQWLKSVILDQLLVDRTGSLSTKEATIFSFVGHVLARILGADNDENTFRFSNRHDGKITFDFHRKGKLLILPDLHALSAGQADVFCTFCNIIRDFDQTNAPFNSIGDVRGIVILDEADLHLHIDLQYRVVPELMKLFPNVQFILSTHSPLLLMGMQKFYGENAFRIREIPNGELIETEQFSEFDSALGAFVNTATFDQIVVQRIMQSSKPLLITEGKSDVILVTEAWTKLNGNQEMPFEVNSCGAFHTDEGKGGKGGATMLRTMLHALCLYSGRLAIGLFDHDEEGVNAFNSLKKDGFKLGADPKHSMHASNLVHAMLLPAPPGRKQFVSETNSRSCFLALEHYFSDSVLAQYNMMEPIAADSKLFRIDGNKASFSRGISKLDSSEFTHFAILFQRIANLISVQPEVTNVDVPFQIETQVMMVPLSSIELQSSLLVFTQQFDSIDGRRTVPPTDERCPDSVGTRYG